MQEFCESSFLENMVKNPTRFKNPAKPTCIDLIITNKPGMFHELVIKWNLVTKKPHHAWSSIGTIKAGTKMPWIKTLQIIPN